MSLRLRGERGCAVSCLPLHASCQDGVTFALLVCVCLSHSAPGVQLARAMVEVNETIALWSWFMAGTCIPAFDRGINCFQGLFVSFEV